MKILIAEDEAVSRRLLQSFLQKWGYEVIVTQNGADAWQHFSDGEDIDIVISDWMMPQLEGPELIRRIRAAARPGYVYTILLTSMSQKKSVIQGMAAGADDFVTKPFDHEELQVRLNAGVRIVRLERTLSREIRALRETQAALIQSENLASLGQLAAGMAHEINNPLAYVTNNLAVLRRDVLGIMEVLALYRTGWPSLARAEPELAAEVARLEGIIDLAYLHEHLPRQFETSLEGLKRVRDIVSNLRDFARIDEVQHEEGDLNAAMAATLEVLRHEIRKKEIRLETDFQADLPRLPCHPGKINQVFLNLLVNAIQASDPGGLIEVRTRAEPEAAVVTIRDHGCGIAPEHRPHIFEPFFTTKTVGLGMGLGLSVGYGIVRSHGGTIEVDSAPGCGSTFRVRLPWGRPDGTRAPSG